MNPDATPCELCTPTDPVAENALAYARLDSNSLSRGHVLVVPRRHVADFFDMTGEEQSAVLALLNQAHERICAQHSPDGFNTGVNIGKAAGQSRMHAHVHLIPRYASDVADPRGGIRRVQGGRAVPPDRQNRGRAIGQAPWHRGDVESVVRRAQRE